MIAPARAAAYEALQAHVQWTADLPHALARVRTRLPDERDRALIGEIVTGTLRWQGAFDHVIAAFGRRPVTRLDSEVLDILRSAIFQLLHLDRVPASAVVNDAVTLTKKAGKKSAGPFVNALLRRVAVSASNCPCRLVQSTPAAGAPRSTTCLSPCRIPDGWRPMARQVWLRSDGGVASVQQPPGAAHASRQPAADSGDLPCRVPGRTRREVAPGHFAPDAWVV